MLLAPRSLGYISYTSFSGVLEVAAVLVRVRAVASVERIFGAMHRSDELL